MKNTRNLVEEYVIFSPSFPTFISGQDCVESGSSVRVMQQVLTRVLCIRTIRAFRSIAHTISIQSDSTFYSYRICASLHLVIFQLTLHTGSHLIANLGSVRARFPTSCQYIGPVDQISLCRLHSSCRLLNCNAEPKRVMPKVEPAIDRERHNR